MQDSSRLPSHFLRLLTLCLAVALSSAPALAGPIFITGHDPDYHAQSDAGAQALLKTGLNFVTNGTWNGGAQKFLWVESNAPVLGGHLFGMNSLLDIGLTQGVNFDHVDAAGLASANLSNYSAIVVASSFGGMLTEAEISELITRKTDIQNFVNAGGGLFAMSECGFGWANCDPTNIGNSSNNSTLFGFLPVTATSVSEVAPFTITPYGSTIGAPFSLNSADLNDPTHNSFAPIAGLNAVDLDAAGHPTTLAGDVGITNNGFQPVPEPSSMLLLASGLAGLVKVYRKRRA